MVVNKDDTNAQWLLLLQDFNDMKFGRVAGEPVAKADADGNLWCFYVLFGKADLDCEANSWGCPHYNSHEMCSLCLANDSNRPFTDFSAGAAWRPSAAAMLNFAFMCRFRLPLHPLVASEYFDIDFMRLDLMHVADLNGIVATVAGSMLIDCIRMPALGVNQQIRLDAVNANLFAYYARHPGCNRMPAIALSNCTLEGWGFLHGPTVKAANSRGLVPWLGELSLELFAADTNYHISVRKICASLKNMYDVLYCGRRFLSDPEKQELACSVERVGRHLGLLRELSRIGGHFQWQVKPKSHLLMHVPQQSRLINSRFTQCYAEESLVGRMTMIWKACVNGRYANTVERHVMLKYLLSLTIMFEW